MSDFIRIRCPGGCGHVRGEAKDGSQVRLQCRQCKIKFFGYVNGGKFHHTGTIHLDRQSGMIASVSPPSLKG